jgi:hypothetical protein
MLGSYISTSTSSSVSANNTWKTASVTATSPATASYATLEISSNSSGTYYIDQVCMQLGNSVAYDEARAIDVFLNPTKTNYIKNPSFETNVTDGWTKTGLATISQDSDVSDLAYSSSNSAKVIATGAWSLTSNAIPITVGNYYTFSSLFKSTSDLTVTFIGRNSDGDILENNDIYNIGLSSTWSLLSATDLTDSTHTDIATYEVVYSGNAGTFYFDCVQFELGSVATDYFDGSLPSNYGAVWGGTANNSYTYLYPNKPQKIPRLGYTFVDWVPKNTFWRLRTYSGVEYTNLTV